MNLTAATTFGSVDAHAHDAPPPPPREPVELTTIALVTAVQFVVSTGSRLLGVVVSVVAGPYAVFVLGVPDYGLQGLLLATLLVLVPKPFTAALQITTLWLLNVIFTGGFSLAGVVYLAVSVLVHELIFAAGGLTTTARLRQLGSTAPWSLAVNLGFCVGMAKAVTSAAQLIVARVLYHFSFPDHFIVEAAGVALVCGLIGGVYGTRLAFRLRSVAP